MMHHVVDNVTVCIEYAACWGDVLQVCVQWLSGQAGSVGVASCQGGTTPHRLPTQLLQQLVPVCSMQLPKQCLSSKPEGLHLSRCLAVCWKVHCITHRCYHHIVTHE
jgi:hypothetical protein